MVGNGGCSSGDFRNFDLSEKNKMEGSSNNDNNAPVVSVEASLQDSYLTLWAKLADFVKENIMLMPEHAPKIMLIFQKDPMLILMVMIQSIAQGKDTAFRAVVDSRDFELLKAFGARHGLMREDFHCEKAVIEKAFDFAELFFLVLDQIMRG